MINADVVETVARWEDYARLGLFDVGVEAVGEELLAHGFGVFAGGEGAYLDVEEFVIRVGADGYDVAATLEGGADEVGVLLMREGGDLDDERLGTGGHGRS